MKSTKKYYVRYKKTVEFLDSLGVKVTYAPVPRNPNFPDSKEKFNFLIFFETEKNTFELYFSQSHRKGFVYGRHTIYAVDKAKDKVLLENKYPDLDSVLDCIVSDSDCLDYGFDDWCDNLGYDSDSRKAEKIYNNCIEQSKGARLIFDFEFITEYLESEGLR